MTLDGKKAFIGYTCGIGASIFWGFHAVVIRWLVQGGVDPFLIGTLRLFTGSAILAAVVGIGCLITKKPFPRIKYSKYFWMIAASLGLNFILFHKGLEYTIASDAILLEAFSPVTVLIVVMLFLPNRIKYLMKTHGLPNKILLTVIVGSIGSALLLLNDVNDLLIKADSKLWGDLIEFGAMFAWSLVLLSIHEYQNTEKPQSTLALASQFFFFAAIIIAPFAKWSSMAEVTPPQWMWIFVLGIFSTGVAYVLWNIASKHLDVFPLMTLFNFASIFNVTTESIVLGLTLTWKLLVGGIMILYAAIQAEILNKKYKIVKPDEMVEQG